MELKLYNEKTAEISTIVIEDSLSDLVGGNKAELSKKLRTDVDIGEISPGKYILYLVLTDPATGRHIQLANEQEEEEYGYRLGELTYH